MWRKEWERWGSGVRWTVRFDSGVGEDSRERFLRLRKGWGAFRGMMGSIRVNGFCVRRKVGEHSEERWRAFEGTV
jgi:hypothetical protein